jgi:mono/diheme cytochrome c family protein
MPTYRTQNRAFILGWGILLILALCATFVLLMLTGRLQSNSSSGIRTAASNNTAFSHRAIWSFSTKVSSSESTHSVHQLTPPSLTPTAQSAQFKQNIQLSKNASDTTNKQDIATERDLLSEPVFATPAERGYWLLLNKAYLPPDFDQDTFDHLWECWEEPLRSQAQSATLAERRKIAFARYGLIRRDSDPLNRPLQYVVSESGNWSMNCLACHQGQVAEKVIPGVANAQFNMQTLYEDVRATKLKLGKKLTHMDLGSAFLPLSSSRGTTNAVMFGVVLLNFRDANLNLDKQRPRPALTNHDHDPPAWWQLHRKRNMYIDGFAAKNHRALMQFLLVEQNGPRQFQTWEADFQDILAWIESLRPPRFPGKVDANLAQQGKHVFKQNCAKCHGTYGTGGEWPARSVPLGIVKTDSLRLTGLTVKHRTHYAASWFAKTGPQTTQTEPAGYIAPPLDGVWATAPYFHNGSVPTLWHVLNPAERPKIWSRAVGEYDLAKVGQKIEAFTQIPPLAKSPAAKREYYDTSEKGKSAQGHDFAAPLSAASKRALLEYLKTL